MKKTFFLIIVLTYCFLNTTCKKATKYPVNLAGYWVGNEVGNCFCSTVYMDIPANDTEGKYGAHLPEKGCDQHWSGKVRYIGNYLFVGNTRFKFIEKPVAVSNGDTVYFNNGSNKRGVVTAQMTLINSTLHGKDTYRFRKVIEY